jgi:hypothetical protein
MARPLRDVWFSPLFENTHNGGVLLTIPYDALADWDGTGEDYEEVIEEEFQFQFRPIGPTLGLFIGDFDGEGIHEAHWMRFVGDAGVMLVVWSSWDDAARRSLPEDKKRVGRAWREALDPRQAWLAERLRRTDLVWEQYPNMQAIPSGILLLMHAEGVARKARLASPRHVAKCGQAVPIGLLPGEYRVETLVIDELPDGANLCAVCRWIPHVL